MYWKSEVHRVKRKGESTIPCGAPVNNPEGRGGVYNPGGHGGVPRSSKGWIVLKAPEKSKNMILTVPPSISRRVGR